MSLFQPTPEKLQKKQAILTVSFPQSWQREFIWMIQQWLICDQRLGLVYCFAGIVLLLVIISFLYSWATYSSLQGAIHSRYLFYENPFQAVCMSLLGHTHSRLFAFPIFPAMSSSCASDCLPNVSEQKRSGKAATTFLGVGGVNGKVTYSLGTVHLQIEMVIPGLASGWRQARWPRRKACGP